MTKEEIYDSELAPLVNRVLEICKQNKIAMIADFSLDDDLSCTSALLANEYNPRRKQLQALDLLWPQPHFALAETMETMPDGGKRISIRRIS